MEDLDNAVQTIDIKEKRKIEKSLDLQKIGDYDKAIRILEDVTAPDHAQSAVSNNLGCLYFEKGEYEQS